MVIFLFVSFCVGAFHVKSIKNGEIYMTVFDFYEILCVGLWSWVYASHTFLGQPQSASIQAIVSLKTQ